MALFDEFLDTPGTTGLFDEFLNTPDSDSELESEEPQTPSRFDALFAAAEAQYPSLAQNPGLLREVARVESNFNPNAEGRRLDGELSGATGLMQVMPPTLASVSQRLGRQLDPLDAADSIEIGAYVLDENLRRYKGDKTTALMAYNNSTDPARWNNPETRAYPVKVLSGLKKTDNRELAAAPAANETATGLFDEFLDKPNQNLGLANFKAPTTEPVAAPEPEKGYVDHIRGAFSQGLRNTELNSRAAGFQAGAVSSDELAASIADNARAQTPRPAFVSDYEKRLKGLSDRFKEAKGFLDSASGLTALVGEAVTNPKAIGYQIAESLPNFIPAATLGAAGAVAGSAVGPVGTAVGGYAGMTRRHGRNRIRRQVH